VWEAAGVNVSESELGFAEVMRRLLEAIERRELTVFARIDHAGAARQAGLELADEELVIFGNPRAGTPLMQGDPRSGIELPLRILVWRAGTGAQIGYLDPRELARRYDVDQHQATLEAMAKLLGDIVAEAVA
jgi:uncharacterized protein (DUF302 family)